MTFQPVVNQNIILGRDGMKSSCLLGKANSSTLFLKFYTNQN